MSQKLKQKKDELLAAERGTVYKARGAEVEVALAYPNTYHVGMSNLGLHQIYSVLNNRPDTACERTFLPDEEDLAEYQRTGTRLFTLETGRPVREFDILAFSVSFEQDYLNIMDMLDLAGIPADKKERTAADPLVVFGGICSFFNPEPLADFFDAVIVGEGEEVSGEFVEAYKKNRMQGRPELLRSLSAVPGVYVPEFYEEVYTPDGALSARKKLCDFAPDRVVKRTVRTINSMPAATAIFTPHTEFSDMHLAEITRGCGRHCRFCIAGYIYLPPRCLSINNAKQHAEQADAACGKIGLVGAAISDYPEIDELCSAIQGGISVSSLRADSLDEPLVRRLAASGQKTISIAPEAGSERLRKVINKNITEDDLARAAHRTFSAGIPNLKLYFIIGLPTEEPEDIDAIISLTERMHQIQLNHARAAGKIGRITLSVNSFVPKPFTPFQWEPMEDTARLNRKLRMLEKAARKIGNVNVIHDLPKWEYIQALLSRGDRRIGKLIRAASLNGGDWKKAAKELKMETDWYVTRPRGFNEVLPWDFIDIGVRKEYLSEEYSRARAAQHTPPCSIGTCRACGVCGRAANDEHS